MEKYSSTGVRKESLYMERAVDVLNRSVLSEEVACGGEDFRGTKGLWE